MTSGDYCALDKADKMLDAAKAELARQTKKADGERKALQEKIEERRKEIDRLQNDLNSARSDLKARESSLSGARKEVAELQASLQHRVDEGVNREMSDRLRQWLVPVRNVENAIAIAGQSDLLGRASDALRRQSAIDTHYGNRVTLAQMIEDRRHMLADVNRARIDALNPLPELRDIATELECEISSLVLRSGGQVEQAAEDVSGLLATINSTQSLDALSEVRRFLQQATAHEILNQEELHQLYEAVDNKAALLYDTADVLGEEKSSSPKTRFFLRLAIAKGQAFKLIIDGHNVLYALESIYGPHFERGHPGSKARVELANRLIRIFDKPGADVSLFYDGDDPKQQSLSDQVRVIYSGGTGENRADEAILKHLSFLVLSGKSIPVCLVTRDTDFARQASELGVIILHPEEFSVSLDLASP